MGENRIGIGIDVGGTGIKGAAVDLETGSRITPRERVDTPPGGHPDDVVAIVQRMTESIGRSLTGGVAGVPVGIALPGVIRGGVMLTAANLDPSWIGRDVREYLTRAIGAECEVLNDADAAGLAEGALGAAKARPGGTVVLTFGTGIGSAYLLDGALVPNFELGHLEIDGHVDIERFSSPKVIARDGVPFHEWVGRAGRFVSHVEMLLHPDLFVIGGSISKQAGRFLPFPDVQTPTVPAHFRNDAGIVGAAWAAARAPSRERP